jgi:hypothetical protein
LVGEFLRLGRVEYVEIFLSLGRVAKYPGKHITGSLRKYQFLVIRATNLEPPAPWADNPLTITLVAGPILIGTGFTTHRT